MIMGVIGLIFMLSTFFALHVLFFKTDKESTVIFTLILIVVWFSVILKPF